MYEIRYTDLNGKRQRYMNCGFETKEDAQAELDCIKRERKRQSIMGYYLNRTENIEYNRTVTTGKNFRIKKIKLCQSSITKI